MDKLQKHNNIYKRPKYRRQNPLELENVNKMLKYIMSTLSTSLCRRLCLLHSVRSVHIHDSTVLLYTVFAWKGAHIYEKTYEYWLERNILETVIIRIGMGEVQVVEFSVVLRYVMWGKVVPWA
jgi:hypothetical protein